MIKTKIINILERISGRQIARRTPDRGADLFANIDQIYGKQNFRVVFDVGANVGQTAGVYRKEFPRAEIYSFEPVAATFRELEKNMGANESVHLFQMGFGSHASTVEISVLAENSHISSILHRVGPDSEFVEIQALDDFVAQHGIDKIDLLKIDTEGYELEVLKGVQHLLRKQRIGMMYIEAELNKTSRHFLSVEELSGALKEYGYQIFGVYEQKPGFWTGEHSIFFAMFCTLHPCWSRDMWGQTAIPFALRFRSKA